MADETRSEALGLDYATFDAWRRLVDDWCKFLVFVPVTSVVGVSHHLPAGPCAAAFVFVAGLAVDEIRNTQLHDALGKRLTDLEPLLGEGAAEGGRRGPTAPAPPPDSQSSRPGRASLRPEDV